MTQRDSLTNAKKRHACDDCDEYYTSEALARRLIDHCEAAGARKLVLPCDTDASRIAIYARERADAGAFDDVAVFDDFETALDSVNESYHIVTNPPFSKLSRLIYPRVVDWSGGFTLVAPISSISYVALREKWRKCFFFNLSDKRENTFDRPGGGQSNVASCIISTAYSEHIKKRESAAVPPDDMPLTESGYRLTTVKMPQYPYDVEHDIALPLTSLYYDIPDFVPIDMTRRGEMCGGKKLFTKVIWRYDNG